jgi:uncharacterized protein (TIGR02145 family)
MKTRTILPTITLLFIILTMFFFSCKKENQDEGPFTDTRDGNIYSTVKLGNQIWMAENLAYLPEVSPSSIGAVNSNDYADPFYYVYGYEGADVSQATSNVNYGKYGVLYNWQAAINACPAGWHLPSDADWKELEMFLGMSQSDTDIRGWNRGTNQGSKIAGTASLWENGFLKASSDFGTSGFTALPAGFRSNLKYFTGLGGYTTWWCSTEYDNRIAWSRELDFDYTNLIRDYYLKDYGFSIRCVKN